MPDVIASHSDAHAIDLGEATARLSECGFDPNSAENLDQAAILLAGLGQNRDFLADVLLDELRGRADDPTLSQRYNGQSVLLASNAAAGYMIRANIWPAAEDPLMQRPGADAFQYGFAHDHNFDFLTIGYAGPGYVSEFFAYDYDAIIGLPREAAALTPLPPMTLAQGDMLHYRAHQDVHRQVAPPALSISLNIMHVNPYQSWCDQYGFDVGAGQISRVLAHSPLEALIKLAPLLLPDQAEEAALHFARHHVSDAVRLTAAHTFVGMQVDAGLAWEDLARDTDCAKIASTARAMLADAGIRTV